MWPNQQETASFVTFTEEILNEKLHFCAVLLKKLLWKILQNLQENTCAWASFWNSCRCSPIFFSELFQNTEAHLERSQTSQMEFSFEIFLLLDAKYFRKKAPSRMFDLVLNRLLGNCFYLLTANWFFRCFKVGNFCRKKILWSSLNNLGQLIFLVQEKTCLWGLSCTVFFVNFVS